MRAGTFESPWLGMETHKSWVRGYKTLISELYLLPISAIDIHTDNKGALDLALNPVYHSRTKHIDIESHWVREVLESGLIGVARVSSALNASDFLTKSLSKPVHYTQLGLAGIRAINEGEC